MLRRLTTATVTGFPKLAGITLSKAAKLVSALSVVWSGGCHGGTFALSGPLLKQLTVDPFSLDNVI